MADVKWIKIVTDIFDDEKMLLIDGLPEHDSIIVIWFKLLCMAGKQNNGGVFMLNDKIAYTEEMLSTIFRRPINTVRLALKTFEQFGMIEIVNDTITIPNWGKYQNLDSLENKKNYMRNYMKSYREKQKLLASKSLSETNCKTNVSQTDIEIDKEKDIDKETDNISVEFETLWKMYPRKVGKEAALRAYTKARNDKKDPTTFEQVKQGIENYIRQIKAKHTDTQYIKHGSSWFNARAWKDDYDFSPAKQFSSSPQLVTVNGKEYELRNGKYYTPDGCGIAIDPYAKSDLDDLF